MRLSQSRIQRQDLTSFHRDRRIHRRGGERRAAVSSVQLERLEDRTLLSLLPTTTTLAASVPSPLLGQAETLTATVSPVLPGNGTPTGTVTFYDGSIELETAPLITYGGVTTATLTTSALPVGSQSITATYGGDQAYAGGVSRNISTVASVGEPAGLAFDAQGDLFVADTTNNQQTSDVSELTPGGVLTTFAGRGSSAVVVDAHGVVLIANFNGVFEVTPGPQWLADGTISTIVGDSGCCGYGDGGPPADAYVNNPQGLALDSRGDLIIADTWDNRIREITPGADGLLSDGTITTIAGLGDPLGSTGSQGFGGYTGDGGPAISASLLNPSGLAMNALGDLFIADTLNNVIREVTPGPDGLLSDGTITTVVGNGTDGYSGDGGPATGASLDRPQDVAVDAQGNLFIADTGNNVIREVTPGPDGLLSDGTITTVAGNGTDGYSGDGGPATGASLTRPAGVTFDAEGNLFIADTLNGRVRELGGLVVTVRVVANTTTTVVATPAQAVFGQPITLTATVATANPSMGYPGMVYPTGTVTFYDGSRELGTANLMTADAVTTASLTIPPPPIGVYEITAAYSGDAGFTGSDSRDSLSVSEQPIPPGSAPWGIVTGPDGALWFTENGLSKIGRYDPATGQLTQYATLTAASAAGRHHRRPRRRHLVRRVQPRPDRPARPGHRPDHRVRRPAQRERHPADRFRPARLGLVHRAKHQPRRPDRCGHRPDHRVSDPHTG